MLVDFAVLVAVIALVGATAPRWPDRWLGLTAWHLPFLPWETPAFYRRLGVPWLAARLPEAGALFGGQSKSALPGTDGPALQRYYIEVSRAEWVHVGSIVGACVLFLFNPWWLALGWVAFAAVANGPFLAILRNNRLRLQGLLERMESRT
jgi:hypothetical protein